ncbi:hypothetical protein V6N13_017142 [Hibiscus sabdariffa]|uniref:Uncharacterized protein n=1 Tax=Hibiscus sabdariffa TaxID=183260 RepID=A0ABR2CYH4_9ROSI
MLPSCAAKRVEISPNPPLLPRKLRFSEEQAFKGNVAVAQHSISSTKKKEAVSGLMQHNLMRMLATMAGEKQYPWDFERHEETLGWKLMKINSTIHGGAKVQDVDLKMEFP